jgi:hypothetical protein
MLYKYLKVIQDGEVQSLLEISRSLQISYEMARQIADELTRRGYLQKLGADCSSPRTTCGDCPASNNCQVLTQHWFLTEKGRAALSRIGQVMANGEVTHGVISTS